MGSLKLNKKQQTVLIVAVSVMLVAAVALVAALVTEMKGAQAGGDATTLAAGAASTEKAASTAPASTSDGSETAQTQTEVDDSNHKSTRTEDTVVHNPGDNDTDTDSHYGYTTMPTPTLGEKTGTNHCTDDPENKYIVVIAAKYKVDPALLVCIYPENFDGTESDNNFVMQFDGTQKEDGTYLRSPDALEAVYQVKADEKTVKYTSYDVAGKFVFTMVTDLMMPQHTDVFDIE